MTNSRTKLFLTMPFRRVPFLYSSPLLKKRHPRECRFVGKRRLKVVVRRYPTRCQMQRRPSKRPRRGRGGKGKMEERSTKPKHDEWPITPGEVHYFETLQDPVFSTCHSPNYLFVGICVCVIFGVRRPWHWPMRGRCIGEASNPGPPKRITAAQEEF